MKVNRMFACTLHTMPLQGSASPSRKVVIYAIADEMSRNDIFLLIQFTQYVNKPTSQ
jgi:hypothetical protein